METIPYTTQETRSLLKYYRDHEKPLSTTTRHNEQRPAVYKVSHFTPAARSCWCWMVFVPLVSVRGMQPTITGHTVDTGAGTTMWTGLAGAPHFDDREQALRWTELMSLPNVVVELD